MKRDEYQTVLATIGLTQEQVELLSEALEDCFVPHNGRDNRVAEGINDSVNNVYRFVVGDLGAHDVFEEDGEPWGAPDRDTLVEDLTFDADLYKAAGAATETFHRAVQEHLNAEQTSELGQALLSMFRPCRAFGERHLLKPEPSDSSEYFIAKWATAHSLLVTTFPGLINDRNQAKVFAPR